MNVTPVEQRSERQLGSELDLLQITDATRVTELALPLVDVCKALYGEATGAANQPTKDALRFSTKALTPSSPSGVLLSSAICLASRSIWDSSVSCSDVAISFFTPP